MRDRELIVSEILECEIKIAALNAELYMARGDEGSAIDWCERMKALIARRSSEQIARMEAAIEGAF